MDQTKNKIDKILSQSTSTPDAFLLEQPRSIRDTQFGLDDDATNREWAKKFLARKHEVIQDTADYKVIQTGRNGSDGGYIVLIRGDLIGYMVKYQTTNKKLSGKTVTQVAVWRKVGRAPLGFTTEIFFGHLLQHWPAVMSDAEQTQAGENFWRDRMAYAVDRNYRVGIVDFNTHSVDWYDNSTNNLEQWINSKNAWGKPQKHAAQRFIISN